jgi:catechol 2,3-dioxygenase-like lactoylglutathione lyase family enzyme
MRAAFLGVQEGGDALAGTAKTFIDLVQYNDPPVSGEPYPSLFNVGWTRVAFRVGDITALHEKVQAAGVENVSAPAVVGPPDQPLGYFCLVDPNGVVVEFVGPITAAASS